MAQEGYVEIPMDDQMISATLIALEHTINHCTRTRDEITAFVMARQAAMNAAPVHKTDLDPVNGGDNL